MNGLKFVKTTFGEQKDIICVRFDGANNYQLFIDEVRKTYNLAADVDVDVLSKGFKIKSSVFSHYVNQFIGSTDFVVDIELSNADVSISNSDSAFDVESVDSENIQQTSAAHNCSGVYRPVSCFGEQTFVNFTQDDIFVTRADNCQYLPSNQEISAIPDIRNYLNAKTLENKDRVKIAKALIEYILNQNLNQQLLKEDFVQLSKSIVEIFDFEVKETYYVPFHKGHLAKGKLYDAYNNIRSKLSASGLIRRRVKSQPSKSANDSSQNDANECHSQEKELEIIKTDGLEWDKVLDTWEKSHLLRQEELKNDKTATVEYKEKYRVRLNAKGLELLGIDFKIVYPFAKRI